MSTLHDNLNSSHNHDISLPKHCDVSPLTVIQIYIQIGQGQAKFQQ